MSKLKDLVKELAERESGCRAEAVFQRKRKDDKTDTGITLSHKMEAQAIYMEGMAEGYKRASELLARVIMVNSPRVRYRLLRCNEPFLPGDEMKLLHHWRPIDNASLGGGSVGPNDAGFYRRPI